MLPAKSDERPIRIAVVGPGVNDASPEALVDAVSIGRQIAEAGGVVITGGLDGVMEAACRGARMAAGTTVGFLPGEDAAAANSFVLLPFPTGMGQARNLLVVLSAQALIAVSSSAGTLAEVASAVRLGVPVATIGQWNLPDGIRERVHVSDSADAAISWALRTARAGSGLSSQAGAIKTSATAFGV